MRHSDAPRGSPQKALPLRCDPWKYYRVFPADRVGGPHHLPQRFLWALKSNELMGQDISGQQVKKAGKRLLSQTLMPVLFDKGHSYQPSDIIDKITILQRQVRSRSRLLESGAAHTDYT